MPTSVINLGNDFSAVLMNGFHNFSEVINNFISMHNDCSWQRLTNRIYIEISGYDKPNTTSCQLSVSLEIFICHATVISCKEFGGC